MHFVQGLVEQTIPAVAPDRIAILRLDTDFYSSTRHELEHLYLRLSAGGMLIIDDYGAMPGSRIATDDATDKALGWFLHRVDARAFDDQDLTTLKIRLVCAMWGDPFVDLFWRVAVRSLLAPGNAIDVARACPTRLSIITTRQGAAHIRSSPSFDRLASMLAIDFTTVGPLDPDRASHVVLWRVALDESRHRGETVVFVIPDVVYPRGTLTRWVERLGAGAAALFTPSLQAVCETALPELEQRFPDPAGPIDLDAAAAAPLCLRHLHPLWIAHLRDTPRASFPTRSTDAPHRRRSNIRMLALFPICVDPRRAGLDVGMRPTVPVRGTR